MNQGAFWAVDCNDISFSDNIYLQKVCIPVSPFTPNTPYTCSSRTNMPVYDIQRQKEQAR